MINIYRLQHAEITADDRLWQQCGNDIDLFNMSESLAELTRLKSLGDVAVDEELVAANMISLQDKIQKHAPVSSIPDLSVVRSLRRSKQ